MLFRGEAVAPVEDLQGRLFPGRDDAVAPAEELQGLIRLPQWARLLMMSLHLKTSKRRK